MTNELLKIKRKRIIKIIVAIAVLVVCFFAFRLDINVVKYKITTDKLSKGFRIALITDLHSCGYGKNQKKLLDKIDEQKPDLVMLSGDIIDDELPMDKAKEFLAGISKKYPCFYVIGNHEIKCDDLEKVKQMVADYGITVFEGSNMVYNIDGQNINISGVDDYAIGRFIYPEELEACQKGLDYSKFSILLSHRPDLIEYYEKYSYDVILCGHAHGGQWRIPYLMNGFYSPGQGFFPRYAGGCYDIGKSKMVVSRGLAKESTMIPRIFNRPEIDIIDIEPKSK